MSILAAFMVPHPPMIVPAIGRGSEKQVETTIQAYEQVAREIAALKPDTIVITSPHALMYADYFHISPGKSARGSFSDFGAGQVLFDVDYDEENTGYKTVSHELAHLLRMDQSLFLGQVLEEGVGVYAEDRFTKKAG